LLFGVQPLDPITFVLVGAVLAMTVAIATIAPAWRAARTDPAMVLRIE
jgi:putative ABC transport system permease protein